MEKNEFNKNLTETVRVIVYDEEDNVLLLKKDKTSKAAGLLEFPGGKIDSLDSQIITAKKELLEETGLDIKVEFKKIEVFDYNFQTKDGISSRRVHLFETRTGGVKPKVQLNNVDGEDKHEIYLWVNRVQLEQYRNEDKLSGNSTHF